MVHTHTLCTNTRKHGGPRKRLHTHTCPHTHTLTHFYLLENPSDLCTNIDVNVCLELVLCSHHTRQILLGTFSSIVHSPIGQCKCSHETKPIQNNSRQSHGDKSWFLQLSSSHPATGTQQACHVPTASGSLCGMGVALVMGGVCCSWHRVNTE